MSTRAPVELDFLGLRAAAAADDADDRHACKSSSSASSSSSIRGMETSAIARIGPHLLRRVIVAGPPPPPPAQLLEEKPVAAAAPMTLFYNGSVAVFDVSHDKAEAIMRMVTEATKAKGLARGNAIVGNFAKDMPLTRTKSLQRFLSKRKERLTSFGPYQVGGPAAVGATATTTKSFLVKEEEHTAT